ncbi:MAG TPA: hypothetical protein VI643_01235, partial [Planctomycetota bacterium]|nr:hypothetical protein [Planctomycetota bacterium]
DGDFVTAELARDLGGGESLVTTEDQALKVARHVGVQAVLFGEGRMDDGPDASEVMLKLIYVKAPQQRPNPQEKKSHAVIVERRLTKSFFSLPYYRLRMGETSVFLRVVLWFLIAAGMPFAFYPLELKIFSLESNAASMAVLGGLTALDFIAALLFNGFALSGVWIILYFALVGVSGFYNFAMLNALQEST